jgi:hypothetical protein
VLGLVFGLIGFLIVAGLAWSMIRVFKDPS